MKIRVISTKDDIENLNENEEMVHLSFRPSDKDLLSIINKSQNIKVVQVPSSYMRSLSKSAKMFLDLRNITLLEGDVWGHRKDINEYYEIPNGVYKRINELMDEGFSEDEIIDKVDKETKLEPEFIRFLIEQKYQ